MMHKTKITRKELYQLVWSTPLITLSKQFGISDVGLAKVCRRNDIPLPGLGYWAKVQAGKNVSQPPLPNSDADKEVFISMVEKKPEHVDESQLKDAEIILANIQDVASSFKVVTSLDSLHPIVNKAWRSLRNAPKNKLNILTPKTEQCLSISVTQHSLDRALLFFDLLIRILEKLGCSIEIATGEKKLTFIHILGENIPVSIKEKINILTEGVNHRSLYYYRNINSEATGMLSFIIDLDSYSLTGLRKVWADATKQKIENCMPSIVKGLVNLALKLRANKIEAEIRRKKWEEEARIRAEREQREREERERIEQIERQASNWHKAENIRAYLTTVKAKTLLKYEFIDEGSEMDLWLKWGFSYADRIDPVLKVIG